MNARPATCWDSKLQLGGFCTFMITCEPFVSKLRYYEFEFHFGGNRTRHVQIRSSSRNHCVNWPGSVCSDVEEAL